MSKNHKTLVRVFTTLTDYVERTTHWREGGTDRHAAKLALKDVGEVLDDIEWTEKGLADEREETDRLRALCDELLSELYVYRASKYLKDTTEAIRARGNT